ncbi:uncharacterized protein BDZ83DRAFT_649509 [Colletotrichum acutatum]|uniref:Uncharacterized protein n=1 Tax=Glomerella acutata TaxID=27357 RepID=A0AAD8XIG0_GLOAC|nr:uncharacterized protein BDZ83DRAFT_649509 [Colletotrichum acutatum]KAK1727651.1 hypothetical protein BDZ83DRAFT_649509 [Colletotrichum acutatum]
MLSAPQLAPSLVRRASSARVPHAFRFSANLFGLSLARKLAIKVLRTSLTIKVLTLTFRAGPHFPFCASACARPCACRPRLTPVPLWSTVPGSFQVLSAKLVFCPRYLLLGITVNLEKVNRQNSKQ